MNATEGREEKGGEVRSETSREDEACNVVLNKEFCCVCPCPSFYIFLLSRCLVKFNFASTPFHRCSPLDIENRSGRGGNEKRDCAVHWMTDPHYSAQSTKKKLCPPHPPFCGAALLPDGAMDRPLLPSETLLFVIGAAVYLSDNLLSHFSCRLRDLSRPSAAVAPCPN